MSLQKIEGIIEQMRYERFRWTPVRRVQIPKKNGKTRPLGVPTWTDKLVQEVVRLILEAYYDPQFSDHSHGFRPKRGCHTALTTVHRTWQGTKWFIEGDIRGCFDNIDHSILMSILREKIVDNRFLRLIENLLKAGYCEAWQYKPTLSGTPQGAIVSPILANIYLDKLDQFVTQILIPEYTRGQRRAENLEYTRLQKLAWYYRKTGQMKRVRELELQYQKMPSKDVSDPNYRRLLYVRYADDFLLGFAGPIAEAKEIREKLRNFLATLKLELSEDKTLITHAQTQAAKFLGYEIVVQHSDSKHTHGKRSLNGIIGLRIPAKVVEEKRTRYMAHGKAIHRAELLNDDDFTIVNLYQSEYRGYVQYYSLAQNIAWLEKLRWTMWSSLMKTLACKHKTSVAKICKQYSKTVKLPQGLRKCVEVTVTREGGKKPLIARFGGIPLERNLKATIQDLPKSRHRPSRNELIKRLLADECEICGATENIEVHHIRALKDLKDRGRKEKPLWMQMMSARKRKTLMVCKACHDAIHAGRPTKRRITT